MYRYVFHFFLRNPSSRSWRGVRITDGILYPPSEGWGDATYIVVAVGSGSVGDESVKKEREEERERDRDRESRGMGERNICGKEIV